MKYTFDWTIERDEEEAFDVEISGEYKFGSPARHMDPPEPDEFEIDSITLNGAPFTLTDDEFDAILDWVFDNPPELYDEDWD